MNNGTLKKYLKTETVLLTLFILYLVYQNYLVLEDYGQASGSDVNLHLRLSEGWKRHDWPIFNVEYFNNGYPYPPAFHLTIAFLSTVLFTQPVDIVNLLEVVLLPLVLLSTFYLVYKKVGLFEGALSIFLITTSPAFLDRGSQVIPQTVDMLLFPIAAYFFIENRRWGFISIACYLVYNHWFYSALLLFGLFIYTLLIDKEKRSWFLPVVVLSLPLAMIMFFHATAMLEESSGVNEPQEAAVLNEPLFAIKYLGYPLFFLLMVVAIHLRFHKPGNFEMLLLSWVLGILPMWIFFPDRFIGYLAQPMGILGGIVLGDMIKRPLQRYALILTLFSFAVMTSHFFYRALIEYGEVWIPLNTLSPFTTGQDN